MFLHCYQLKSHDTQELLDTHLTDDYKIIIQKSILGEGYELLPNDRTSRFLNKFYTLFPNLVKGDINTINEALIKYYKNKQNG